MLPYLTLALKLEPYILEQSIMPLSSILLKEPSIKYDNLCVSNLNKFELMFSPDYQGAGNFEQKYDKNGNIIITVDGYTFKPDLSFMNDHAVCKYCGLIYTWDYE